MLAKSISYLIIFMPELPEVETTTKGIRPHLEGQVIEQVILRHLHLRWPIDASLPKNLEGQTIQEIKRRAKYIIFCFKQGYLLIHLGMSGYLRILSPPLPAVVKHDHVDIIISNGTCLRFNDARRFGAIIWSERGLDELKILNQLGPEPLSEAFNPKYLLAKCKHRNVAIKSLIMNQNVVVGVGNIYASEALFLAGIHPLMPAKQLSFSQAKKLHHFIGVVLEKAIHHGGTTLSDYQNSEGKPGYFQQQLNVYGRENQPCVICQSNIQNLRIGQRSSFFCPNCQTT